MRLKVTMTTQPIFRKAIIYSATPDAVYLFLYAELDDTACCADYWFASVAHAQAWTQDTLGSWEWTTIPDPLPGQNQDRE